MSTHICPQHHNDDRLSTDERNTDRSPNEMRNLRRNENLPEITILLFSKCLGPITAWSRDESECDGKVVVFKYLNDGDTAAFLRIWLVRTPLSR